MILHIFYYLTVWVRCNGHVLQGQNILQGSMFAKIFQNMLLWEFAVHNKWYYNYFHLEADGKHCTVWIIRQHRTELVKSRTIPAVQALTCQWCADVFVLWRMFNVDSKIIFSVKQPCEGMCLLKQITATTRCSQDIVFKGNSPSKSYLSGLLRSYFYSPCVAVTLQAKHVHLAGHPGHEVVHRSPSMVPLLPLLDGKIRSRKPVCKVEMYPPGPA